MIILEPLIRVAMVAIDLYMWVVIISAMMTWLVAFKVINTRNRFVYMVGDFLYRLTEPAIRPIRQRMPNLGGVDISPVILILILYFAQMVLGKILFSFQSAF